MVRLKQGWRQKSEPDKGLFSYLEKNQCVVMCIEENKFCRVMKNNNKCT